AKQLGKKEDYKRFSKRAISYRKLFDKQFNLLRPRNDDGSWLATYNPESGANFEKNLGFIEGNAWQYTFMVTHDVKGLMKLIGGPKPFAQRLQDVFDKNQFDMANEPDIAYPYLFNYVKGEEYRTQKMVRDLSAKHFKNSPDGIPGNDDTGTMSAWAVFSMMGIYPVNPTAAAYTITKPMFDRIVLHLDADYYNGKTVEITTKKSDGEQAIKKITIDGKRHKGYFIKHNDFVKASSISIE
ncbi:MAG: glycoside hydrolase family 92 protein, partial [Maribacter sp.]|nr:glycoside hydrolase family 92 protein [Maribacter sp.]